MDVTKIYEHLIAFYKKEYGHDKEKKPKKKTHKPFNKKHIKHHKQTIQKHNKQTKPMRTPFSFRPAEIFRFFSIDTQGLRGHGKSISRSLCTS